MTEAVRILNQAAEALKMPEVGPNYLYFDVLDEGPNTSQLPDDDTHNAIVGAVYGIGIEVAAVVVLFALYELGHALFHLL